MESTRREEARVKKETKEGLEVFRKRQEELDKASRSEASPETSATVADDEWTTTAKKRKREKEGAIKGIKLRKPSSSGSPTGGEQTGVAQKPAAEAANASAETQKGTKPVAGLQKSANATSNAVAAADKPAKPVPEKGTGTKPALGLVDYGSDEDDDW